MNGKAASPKIEKPKPIQAVQAASKETLNFLCNLEINITNESTPLLKNPDRKLKLRGHSVLNNEQTDQ